MFKLRLNPAVFNPIRLRKSQTIGFHCILSFPNKRQHHATRDNKRYCRIQEDLYVTLLIRSAVTIQKNVKVLLAKKLLATLIEQRDREIRKRAATLMQCRARVLLAKRQARYLRLVRGITCVRHGAAKAIQKSFQVYQFVRARKVLSVAAQIFHIRTLAAVNIQRVVKGNSVRKDIPFIKHPNLRRLVTWRYNAHSVYIAGTFTKPGWSHKIQLSYSNHLRDFYTTFFMQNRLDPSRYYFKFLVDGEWLCDGHLPITQDFDGNYNNHITIAAEKQLMPRPQSESSIKRTVPKYLHENSHVKNERVPRPLSGTLDSPRALSILNEESKDRAVRLVFGGYMAAHPKAPHLPLTAEGSADAFFFDNESQIFGISDGVGEWETYGLDPSKFPNELMKNCLFHFQKQSQRIQDLSDFEMTEVMDQILYEAYHVVEAYGSATALLGICKGNYLHTLCLGDSAYMLLRYRENLRSQLTIACKSIEQQHSFNCPYQLAKLPSPDRYQSLVEEGLGALVTLLKRSNRSQQDSPFDGESDMISLRPGDVLIVATDGLFDNLFDKEIVEICERHLDLQEHSEDYCKCIAKALVERAVEKAWDSGYKSPFSRNAMKYGKKYIGGKLDDTTVIVGISIRQDNLSNNIP